MPFRIRADAPSPAPRPTRIAFDNFEVTLRSGELRKNGARIRLQAQPFRLLVLLLESAGEVVAREEICQELWPADTFVDFEHSLAAAVNKIREALGDAAHNPRYIETLTKRGYRFIRKIKPEAPVEIPLLEASPAVELVAVGSAKPDSRWKWIFGVVAATALVAAGILVLRLSRKPANSGFSSQPLAAVPFTSYPGMETAPTFSPDGSRIAFSWDDGAGNRSGRPRYDLYVKAIGSETLLRLTNHASDWISSAWSPDGTQIAFHRLAADDNGIYVVPALGGPERKLIATHTPYDVAAPISWSPDSKWIAYADTENGRPGDRAFLLNVETLESHEFPHVSACRHEGLLTFSHGGQELAILCVHNTTSFEYLITDLQGKFRRSLTTRSEFPSSLAWGGDDQFLLLASSTATGEEFYEIHVNDPEVRRLAGVAGSWPTISNDGHKLAFSLGEGQSSVWRKDLQDPQTPVLQMYASTRPQNNAGSIHPRPSCGIRLHALGRLGHMVGRQRRQQSGSDYAGSAGGISAVVARFAENRICDFRAQWS